MPTKVCILVPGFLGSVLSARYPVIGSVRLWLSPTVLVGLFGRLALPTDDRPDLPPTSDQLEGGGPLGPYYGALDLYLQAKGWTVLAPYADWRRPLSFDGDDLERLIRSQFRDTGPVPIVCHSRGGLLTRYALGKLAATGDAGMVSRVVGLGVPHLGSLNAVEALAGYAPLIPKLEGLSRRGAGYWGPTLPKVDARGVLRSWPALYQLLPDPVRSWLPAEVRAAIYAPASWGAKTLPPYLPHLAAAVTSWAALPPVPDGFGWTDVVGYGSTTGVAVPDVGLLTARGELDYSTDGDGTVPIVSAGQAPRRRVYTPTAHDMLPNDGRLWPYIDAALGGALPADVTIEGSLLALPG